MDKNQDLSCRRNRVGGQAVIEGVMMKKGSDVALAVRKEDGSVEIHKSKFVALKTKHKWINIPILRGIVGFVESLMLSFKTLGKATDMLGLEEEEERIKAEKKAKKEAKKNAKNKIQNEKAEGSEEVAEETEGEKESEMSSADVKEDVTQSVGSENESDASEKGKDSTRVDKTEEKKRNSGATTAIIMAVSLILGLALAVLLFIYLPGLVANFTFDVFDLVAVGGARYLFAAIEGIIKVLIFIAYLLLVSLMKDIRRTFQYHGAEHKSIACYESGMELTPENARKCTRYHPRCGTSFMFVMILLGIIVGMFIPVWEPVWLRSLIKLAILPLIMGLGYEFIMIAGKHENWLTKALSAPGIWMQKITTREPDDAMIEVAIKSVEAVFDWKSYVAEIRKEK